MESKGRFSPIIVSMMLVLASWALYVALALSMSMHRGDVYGVERTAFMGAVSMVAFERPLGVIDQATSPLILDFSRSAQDLINQVSRGGTGGVRGIVNDGTGIGYVVVSSLAMRVFGLDVFAPAYLMFLLGDIDGPGFRVALSRPWRRRGSSLFRFALDLVIYATRLESCCGCADSGRRGSLLLAAGHPSGASSFIRDRRQASIKTRDRDLHCTGLASHDHDGGDTCSEHCRHFRRRACARCHRHHVEAARAR